MLSGPASSCNARCVLLSALPLTAHPGPAYIHARCRESPFVRFARVVVATEPVGDRARRLRTGERSGTNPTAPAAPARSAVGPELQRPGRMLRGPFSFLRETVQQ